LEDPKSFNHHTRLSFRRAVLSPSQIRDFFFPTLGPVVFAVYIFDAWWAFTFRKFYLSHPSPFLWTLFAFLCHWLPLVYIVLCYSGPHSGCSASGAFTIIFPPLPKLRRYLPDYIVFAIWIIARHATVSSLCHVVPCVMAWYTTCLLVSWRPLLQLPLLDILHSSPFLMSNAFLS